MTGDQAMALSRNDALRAAEACVGMSKTDASTVSASIAIHGVTGPSGRLAFALAMVDLLETGDILAGRSIAATGTIEADGTLGPIGGLAQKVRAAEAAEAVTFFVPASQVDEAEHIARATRVVGVKRLSDAVALLRDGDGCAV